MSTAAEDFFRRQSTEGSIESEGQETTSSTLGAFRICVLSSATLRRHARSLAAYISVVQWTLRGCRRNPSSTRCTTTTPPPPPHHPPTTATTTKQRQRQRQQQDDDGGGFDTASSIFGFFPASGRPLQPDPHPARAPTQASSRPRKASRLVPRLARSPCYAGDRGGRPAADVPRHPVDRFVGPLRDRRVTD
jgi:hypothetical protein